VEAVKIDTAMDDPDPVRGDAVDGLDMRRDEGGYGDHGPASCHDRIVEALRLAPGAVDSVKGRDEPRAGAARGEERAPGRGATARMDDIDALAPDQGGQPQRICGDHRRVLGGRR